MLDWLVLRWVGVHAHLGEPSSVVTSVSNQPHHRLTYNSVKIYSNDVCAITSDAQWPTKWQLAVNPWIDPPNQVQTLDRPTPIDSHHGMRKPLDRPRGSTHRTWSKRWIDPLGWVDPPRSGSVRFRTPRPTHLPPGSTQGSPTQCIHRTLMSINQ